MPGVYIEKVDPIGGPNFMRRTTMAGVKRESFENFESPDRWN